MSKKTIPAISIIVPMYNAEKYIGECLDSIFAQTFQDFEIIVVDDCSTDNSAEIVENYLRHKNKAEKLCLVHSQSNEGNAAAPRNLGLRHSIGEYVIFIDSDDAITPKALSELYNVAKNFDADIIYAERYYQSSQEKISGERNTVNTNCRNVSPKNKATPVYENLAERMAAYSSDKMPTTPWNYFFRRKLIIENDINFPKIKHGEDEVFNFHALCCAKNLVCVPNIFYIYRIRPDSLLHQSLSVEKYIQNWYSSIFKAIGFFDEIMSKFKFFEENPQYKYMIFDSYTRKNLIAAPQIYSQIHPGKLEKLIRYELESVQDKTALTAFLFSRMNVMSVNVLKQQDIIRQLQKKL